MVLKTENGLEFLIDDDDFHIVKGNSVRVLWSGRDTIRPYLRIKGKYLHRIILKAPKGVIVDHVNGDALDNRKSNLRLCSIRENTSAQHAKRKNKTSIFKGVNWDKRRNKWAAFICHKGRSIGLGRFNREVDAAMAYNDAARRLFGEFAVRNKIE